MRAPLQHRRTAAAAAAFAAACAAPPPVITDDLQIPVPPKWTAADAAADQPLTDDWWTTFTGPELDALVREGLANNRDLQAAVARLEEAAAVRTIAGGAAWPEADAALDAQRARRLFLGFPFGSGGVPSSTATTFGLSVSLRWELDVWGRVRAGESAAIAEQQATLADFHGARLSLTGQICRAWFAAVESRQQLALAVATVTAFRATVDDVRDRYRRGVRPALDVHLASTNLANAEAFVAQRREQLQRDTRGLEVLLGRYPGNLAGPTIVLPTVLPPVPASLPGELLQRRPDLVAAERRVAAAGSRVDSARAALYPRLSLTGSAGTASEDLEDLADDDFRVWSIGANLLAPLFRGGALRGEVERQQAQRAEALALYGGAVLRAFAEVEDVLATDVELAVRRDALARSASHAASARDLARQRYQFGLADFLAVADGQRQAFLAESALIATDRARLDNRIDLFLALGGGFTAEAVRPEPQGDEP